MIRSSTESSNAGRAPDDDRSLKNDIQKPCAIVVLPPGSRGRITNRSLRRWLSQGRVGLVEPKQEVLHTVLEAVGHSAAGEGLAALRFWGQTGQRSGAWMAAADPVYLEARLDHLCLHSLQGRVPVADLHSMFDYLQKSLGSDEYAFARIGGHAYLRGNAETASAEVSSAFADGQPPDSLMPQGPGAESYHRLVSEAQMALHEHDINRKRERAGLEPVNSIWLWGGGRAPEISVQPILPLFADDPLYLGFWLSRTGVAEPWTDDFGAMASFAERGFVAVAPVGSGDDRAQRLESYLRQLKLLLRRKRIGRLSLLFDDGLRADVSGNDRFRFWRRESLLLEGA